MGYNFCKIVIVLATITPILAAFKDFVIESENDLQRFGVSKGNMLHDDNMYDELFYDDFAADNDDFNAVGSICERIEDSSRNYDIESGEWPVYDGNIDEKFLNEIIQHFVNQANFPNYLNSYQGP